MDGERERGETHSHTTCEWREGGNALHGIKNTVNKQWSTMNILCFLFRNNIE